MVVVSTRPDHNSSNLLVLGSEKMHILASRRNQPAHGEIHFWIVFILGLRLVELGHHRIPLQSKTTTTNTHAA